MTLATLRPENNRNRRVTGRDDASNGAAGDFIDETVAIWQRRTERQLTREDGREMIENMTGFFRVLQEWDRAERARKYGR